MFERYINVNWILILVKNSTSGYGYILTWMEVHYHGNMLKCCGSIMIYYASINYSYFQCIVTVILSY